MAVNSIRARIQVNNAVHNTRPQDNKPYKTNPDLLSV